MKKEIQNAEGCLLSRQSAEETLRVESKNMDVFGDSAYSVMPQKKRSRLGFIGKTSHEPEKTMCVSFEEKERHSSSAEPPVKRRRFQRRNSQTAKMLVSSISSFATSDFGCNVPSHNGSHCAPFDENIEIAEDLVRQLNFYRQGITTK